MNSAIETAAGAFPTIPVLLILSLALTVVVIVLAYKLSRQPKVESVDADGKKVESAWANFWLRWEWKPMRLPLIIIALASIWLLSTVVAGVFGAFESLITELNEAPNWWDIAVLFGFFGSIITWLSMATMAIIAIAVHLSQDSPPPDQGSVPAEVHKALIEARGKG